MQTVDSIFELIGRTPIKRLTQVTQHVDSKVFVKIEYLNPSGSLKDRIALRMIEDAEKSGALSKGMQIIEASTGNTGIALSFVGTLKGYPVIIYMPERISQERINIIERYGAKVELIPGDEEQNLKKKEESISGAVVEAPLRIKCLQLEQNNPKDIWWARQFSNPSNVAAHNKTGHEILDQLRRVDTFVAAIGTGGTLYGIAEVLRNANPDTRIVAVEPASDPFIHSIGNPIARTEVSGGIISDLIDNNLVDEIVMVSDKNAVTMAHRLVTEEGLFSGMSAGANVLVALQEAKKLGPDGIVATILPDSMDRYLSSEHFTT